MAMAYIVPLGFIEEIKDDGGTFTITDSEDSASLALGGVVKMVIWR